MTTQHTPEPKLSNELSHSSFCMRENTGDDGVYIEPKKEGLCTCLHFFAHSSMDACQGINPEAVPDLLISVEDALVYGKQHYVDDEGNFTEDAPGWFVAMSQALKELKA